MFALMSFDSVHPEYKTFSDIYIDETSQTKHRFLLLGGLIVPTSQADDFVQKVIAARLPELPSGEMGWTKVSRTKLPAYKRVVDAFFQNGADCHHLDFHCLAVDTHKQNHHAFNSGSGEIGFNKEVYQLAMKFGRLYKGRLFHCYPDNRTTSSSTEELRLILNLGMRKKGDPRDWPFRRLHFRESNESQALQVVDVLLGAVAYQLNEHHLVPGASPAKCELSEYVLKKAGITDVKKDTSVGGRFTLWHRQLKTTSRNPRPQGPPPGAGPLPR
jgi:hypothetical protein